MKSAFNVAFAGDFVEYDGPDGLSWIV